MSTGPTEVEQHLVRESIMLPLLIQTLENNIERMKSSDEGRPIQQLYIGTTAVMIDTINADLTEVRKALRSSNIKVWEDKAKFGVNNSLHYRYTCRGYEHELQILRDQAKAELGTKLGKYSKIIEDRVGIKR